MEELKHSKLGVASFIASLVSAIALFILVFVAAYFSLTGKNEESIEMVIIGLFLIFFIFTSCTAFILGIAGLFQQNVRKLYAALGALCSGLSAVGIIALIALGLASR
jgi:succinate dehydrogenase hydrophobic anchor subunit